MRNAPRITGKFISLPFTGGLPAGMTSNVTGATTLTNNANRLTFSGGSGSVSTKTEYIELNQAYWSYSYLRFQLKFKPLTSGTGFSIAMKNIDDTVTTELYFNLATGALTCTTQTTTAPVVSYSYTIDGGIYTLDVGVDYQGLTTTFGVKKYSKIKGLTPMSYSSLVFTELYNPKAYKFRIIFYGGSADFYLLEGQHTRTKRPQILGIGDSNMGSHLKAGSWFNVLKTNGPTLMENFSWGGARSDQMITLLPQIIADKPTDVFVNCCTNGLNQGVSVATETSNITTIANTLVAAGIRVHLISIFPSSQGFGANIPTLNTNLQGLANGSTIFYIDIFPSLVSTGTTPNPTLFNDNLHINAAGVVVVNNIMTPYLIALGYMF